MFLKFFKKVYIIFFRHDFFHLNRNGCVKLFKRIQIISAQLFVIIETTHPSGEGVKPLP